MNLIRLVFELKGSILTVNIPTEKFRAARRHRRLHFECRIFTHREMMGIVPEVMVTVFSYVHILNI